MGNVRPIVGLAMLGTTRLCIEVSVALILNIMFRLMNKTFCRCCTKLLPKCASVHRAVDYAPLALLTQLLLLFHKFRKPLSSLGQPCHRVK